MLCAVDSEYSKFACISGGSECNNGSNIVREIGMCDSTLGTWPWRYRALSSSNCADGHSRLEIPDVFLWHACNQIQPASTFITVRRNLANQLNDMLSMCTRSQMKTTASQEFGDPAERYAFYVHTFPDEVYREPGLMVCNLPVS